MLNFGGKVAFILAGKITHTLDECIELITLAMV